MNTWIDTTGDVVAGDTIRFSEGVFGGSFRNPKYQGDRVIIAKVVKDSYGKDKQQHTFTLEVVECEGVEPLQAGSRTARKGRNVYRNGTKRLLWNDESKRRLVADEKHTRGDKARAEREVRKNDLC